MKFPQEITVRNITKKHVFRLGISVPPRKTATYEVHSGRDLLALRATRAFEILDGEAQSEDVVTEQAAEDASSEDSFSVTENSVRKVLAAIGEGVITAEEAIEAEQASDEPRSSLLKALGVEAEDEAEAEAEA